MVAIMQHRIVRERVARQATDKQLTKRRHGSLAEQA